MTREDDTIKRTGQRSAHPTQEILRKASPWASCTLSPQKPVLCERRKYSSGRGRGLRNQTVGFGAHLLSLVTGQVSISKLCCLICKIGIIISRLPRVLYRIT